MIKKHFWEILLVMLLLTSNLQAKPEIIESKVLSSDKFNASVIASANMLIDSNDKVFVEIHGREDFLWLNNKWVSTQQYGEYLNGYVRDGCVYLAFLKDKQNIDIYSVSKNISLENSITISKDFPMYPGIDQVIYVSGENNIIYLLGSRQQLPRKPLEFILAPLSTGHGKFYSKPVLAEIQGQRTLEYEKPPYGGKTDESYHVEVVLTKKDTIHFLGFRTQKQLLSGYWGDVPDVMHYAEYNVKKKKLVRSQDIYERLPYFDKIDKRRQLYWHVSADNFGDELFVIFSWQGIRYSKGVNELTVNMENTNSPIYYSQSDGTAFGKVAVIGQGILPLTKADSSGNIHVIWTNSDGDLVHRAKKDGKWNDEQVVLDNVIESDYVWKQMRQGTLRFNKISAEFDKDNNLIVVFTSKGNLTYAKIRVN